MSILKYTLNTFNTEDFIIVPMAAYVIQTRYEEGTDSAEVGTSADVF